MRWGWIRIGIFSIAFLLGLLIGPMWTSAGLEPSGVLRVNDHMGGAALIVACDGGDAAVWRIGGAVQIECAKGKIVVVRERSQRTRPLPMKESRTRSSGFE